MKQEKIKQNDALKESLFRAYNACRCINVGQALPDNKESLITNNSCVVGPEQPLLRTSALSNKGFTLIELLVVVLIIGILAAIAVPQYQKAVEKSRAAEAIAIMRTIYNNEALCHIEYNPDDEFCTIHSNWAIDLNGGTWKGEYNYVTQYFIYDLSDLSGIDAWRCVGKCTGNYDEDTNNANYDLWQDYQHVGSYKTCSGYTSLGESICQALGY